MHSGTYTGCNRATRISNTRARVVCIDAKSRPTNEWLCYNLPRDGSYRNLLNYSDPCPGRRDPVVARVAVREDHFHPSIFDFDYTRPRERALGHRCETARRASDNNGIRDECEMPVVVLCNLRLPRPFEKINLFIRSIRDFHTNLLFPRRSSDWEYFYLLLLNFHY